MIAVWFLAGLLGSFLLWNEERQDKSLLWCPTPRAILLGVIGSGGGGLTLAFSFICVLTGIAIRLSTRAKPHAGWWTTPICKSKTNK